MISHTNAAREEVEKKLAHHPAASAFLGYPHFIGTVTAFLDRYIALPYLRGLGWSVHRIDDEVFAAAAGSRWRSKQALVGYAQMNNGANRGAPYHPQTQGKIERWHQPLKNRILLENYYLPGDLENQISAFVDHYNNQRYHESIGNVTPADAYFGRHTAIIEKRKRIKKLTTQNRRLNHQRQAA